MNTMPATDMVRTGQNIRDMRVKAGLSVKDLQMLSGFSTPSALYKWQRGTAFPTIDHIVVLAAVFGVRADDIPVIHK